MDEDLKKILEQNLEINQKVLETVSYIKRYIIFQKIWGVIKIFIVIIPIIIGIIYLPPLLKGLFEPFRNVFGVMDSVSGVENIIKNGRLVY